MGKPYSAPVLEKTAREAHARGDFDFLLPLAKPLLRTDEVSKTIGRSPQFVRELIKIGKLEAHQDNAFGSGERQSPLVTNRSVILYLAETANYDPAFLVLRIESLLRTLNGPALDRLIAAASRQRQRIG